MSAAVVNTGQSVFKVFLRSVYNFSGVSISTDGRRNASAYFAHRSRLLFFHKEKVTSLTNVVNKIYIVKSK